MNRKKVRTFALHRIRQQKVLKSEFKRPRAAEIQAHFSGSFGVWSYDGDEATNSFVRIRFSGHAAGIVPKRNWHPTQEIHRDGKWVELRMKLRGLDEVTRWIMSWGKNAEVLEPAELREKIRTEIQGLTGIYAARSETLLTVAKS